MLSVTLESQNEILLRIVARSLEIIIFSKWFSFLFLSDAFSPALKIKINPVTLDLHKMLPINPIFSCLMINSGRVTTRFQTINYFFFEAL